MNKIGIFYGPEKGSVNKIASLIAQELGENAAELIPVKNCDASTLSQYNKLIFGISTIGRTTWDAEHTDDDWDQFFPILEKVDWVNKKVAIYGLGDQINYADHFVDAIFWLYEKLKTLNAEVVGYFGSEGYQFNESEAFIDGKFLGLPLDEDNEPEKSPERIQQWLEQLKNEGF